MQFVWGLDRCISDCMGINSQDESWYQRTYLWYQNSNTNQIVDDWWVSPGERIFVHPSYYFESIPF